MVALSRLPRFAEILVGKVIIHGNRLPDPPLDSLNGLTAGLAGNAATFNPLANNPGNQVDGRDGTGQEVEDIDFGLIGKVCPNVTDIEILTYFSGSLLWVTQKLLKSLPCSAIRDWPLLCVEVTISEDSAFDCSTFHRYYEQKIHHGGHPIYTGNQSRNLGWINARSSFRLGQDMPKSLKSIRVNGTVSKRISQMLQKHICSFGDCSFEKKCLSDSSNDFQEARKGDNKQIRYTWHKTGKLVVLEIDIKGVSALIFIIMLTPPTQAKKVPQGKSYRRMRRYRRKSWQP